MVRFISFYTKNTPYEDLSYELSESLQKFSLPHTLYAIEDQGKWSKNVLQKPRIVERAMIDYPDDSIVWIDVDSLVMKKPILFEDFCSKNIDIAVFVREKKRSDPFQYNTFNCVIYFKPGQKSLDFVRVWSKHALLRCNQKIKIPDYFFMNGEKHLTNKKACRTEQGTFVKALNDMHFNNTPMYVEKLPRPYAVRIKSSVPKTKWVIAQKQASRLFKETNKNRYKNRESLAEWYKNVDTNWR